MGGSVESRLVVVMSSKDQSEERKRRRRLLFASRCLRLGGQPPPTARQRSVSDYCNQMLESPLPVVLTLFDHSDGEALLETAILAPATVALVDWAVPIPGADVL